MATTITAKANQSMSDLVIQSTGSMNASGQWTLDNGIAISDVPVVGSTYRVSDAALALGDAGVLQYLQKNRIVIGTLGAGPTVEIYEDEAGKVYTDDDDTTIIHQSV